MKIVFLDFDGVLNFHSINALGYALMPPSEDFEPEHPWLHIDTAAVRRLERLCMETGAHVVVSSSWRYELDVPEIQQMLARRGFTGKVIDATPTTKTLPTPHDQHWQWEERRGREISHWLSFCSTHWLADGQQNYVILDDDPIEGHPHNLVQTSIETGLLDEHVEKAKMILGGISK